MDEYSISDTGKIIRLYRLVRNNPASPEDFLSQQTLWQRRPPDRQTNAPTDAYLLHLWSDVSVSATPELALKQRVVNPRLGPFVAMLEVPVVQCRPERSTNTAGHFTIWGTPRLLFALVRDVWRPQ